jgi:hypothetical protein
MTSDTIPFEAITELVWYLRRDEEKNWRDRHEAGEDVSNHIYHALKTVAYWLDTNPATANAVNAMVRREIASLTQLPT